MGNFAYNSKQGNKGEILVVEKRSHIVKYPTHKSGIQCSTAYGAHISSLHTNNKEKDHVNQFTR